MRTATENIQIIGKATSIAELNAAYNEAMMKTEQLAADGVFEQMGQSVSEVIATLNHLTNYNIVRIANKAFEDYEASGRTDRTRIIEIAQCRDSLKEHEDIETEQGLLDSLCDQFEIN